MNNQINISVVIPLLNEEESLPELYAWIKRVMNDNNYSYEVVFIDDGSVDCSWKVIEELQTNDTAVKGIKFQRNYGKSAALHVGFQKVVGEVVITMDADLQDSPDEIPLLHKKITEENFDLVSGWKKKRYDPIMKTVPTKLFNWATRKLSGISLNDFNCGLKAYKLSVVKSIEVYGEMHRYIPVLAKFAGFKKIGEQVVQHQSRKYGKTKFGMNRFMNGFLDLITVTFIGRFGKKPMHFFGAIGTMLFFLGFLIAVYLGIMKLFVDLEGKLIADRTEFFIALTFMIIGSQMFLTGFIAELLNRNSSTRNNYLVEKEL